MQLTIDGQTRSADSKPRSLRRQGKIPATIYGHKGNESTAITLDTKESLLLLRKAAINNTLIEVNVTDGDFKGITLLREVQYHPYKNDIYHLSFFSIASQSSVEVEIPLHYVGVPIGVRLNGGSLEVMINKIHVACPPNQVPESLEIDITDLDIGQGIHVGDLPLPEGVTLAADGTPLLVTVIKA